MYVWNPGDFGCASTRSGPRIHLCAVQAALCNVVSELRMLGPVTSEQPNEAVTGTFHYATHLQTRKISLQNSVLSPIVQWIHTAMDCLGDCPDWDSLGYTCFLYTI